MMAPDERVDLGLSDVNAGCQCCRPAAAETRRAEDAPASADASSVALLVEGMTCAHCVMSVTEEVSAIEGVEKVTVDLDAGGTSTVTVASAAPIDLALIRAAVEEAGYTPVGRAS